MTALLLRFAGPVALIVVTYAARAAAEAIAKRYPRAKPLADLAVVVLK